MIEEDGTLASASNPVVMLGAYTVIAIVPHGVLAVYNGENRHEWDEETVSFIDANRLTDEEREEVRRWHDSLVAIPDEDVATRLDL